MICRPSGHHQLSRVAHSAWSLARLAAIRAQIGYKKKPGSSGGSPAVVADNTLNWEFDVDTPDQFWGETLFAVGSRTMVERHYLHSDL
jgi:hypothetical protein